MELQLSYLRRKQWEAKLLATEVAKTLFGESEGTEHRRPQQPVSHEQFMMAMGAQWR